MWSRDDRDLWEVLEGLLRWTEVMQLSFHWVKSHLDEIKGVDELKWYERGNVMADAECNMMKGVMAGIEVQQLPTANWEQAQSSFFTFNPLDFAHFCRANDQIDAKGKQLATTAANKALMLQACPPATSGPFALVWRG